MYTIGHIKCTQLINDCTQFYIFNVYNFSIIVQNCVYTKYNNVNNFVHSMFTFFKECTQFCLSNVHKFSKIIYKFAYLMHLIFQ